MSLDLQRGAVIEVGHPFIRAKYTEQDVDGFYETMTWRPGCRVEPVYPDDARYVCDGFGSQVLTIVSIHKPGSFPTRVFFTRQWVDPDGRRFGKNGCRMTTLQAFRRIIGGYRWPVDLADPVPALPPTQPPAPAAPLGPDELAF